MKNNVLYLTKQRLLTLGYHKGRIITFIILTAAFVALNMISMMFLNGSNGQMLSNVFIICASVVDAILMMVLALSIFRGEVTSNQVSLELRQGYKQREIYLARVIEIACAFAVFMLIAVLTNMIAIAVKGQLDNFIWHHMFVTSLGWYAIIGIISVAMSVLFCSFLGSAWSGTIATFIMLIVIVLGGVINGMVQIFGPYRKANDDYAGELISKKIDSEVANFAMNDLGIYSKQQWDEEVVKQFIQPADKTNPDSNPDDFENNDSNNNNNKNTDIIKNIYSDKFKNYSEYYAMVSGDWSQFPEENNDSSWESKIDWSKVKDGDTIDVRNNNYWSEKNISSSDNIFASFAALGTSILAENNLPDNVKKFFADTHEYFKNNLRNITFDDIKNWEYLSGEKGKLYSQYSRSDYGKTVTINYLSPRWTNEKASNEHFVDIMKSVSNAKEFKDYAFLKNIVGLTDDKVLSSMHNSDNDISYSGLYDKNLELNNQLYPTYVTGGNALKEHNMQEDIRNLDISPAELIFNRNIMYFISKAFTDMDEHVNTIAGQTVLGSPIVTKKNDKGITKVYIPVLNTKKIRQEDGTHINPTPLQYGDLPESYNDVFSIKQTVEMYDENDYDPKKPPESSVTKQVTLKDMKFKKLDDYRSIYGDDLESTRKYGTASIYNGSYIEATASDTFNPGETIVYDDSVHEDKIRLETNVISSNNKEFMLTGSRINNYDSQNDGYDIVRHNPWMNTLPSTIVSSLEYKDDYLFVRTWNESENLKSDISAGVKLKDDKGNEIKLNNLEEDGSNGFKQKIGKDKKISVSFDDERVNSSLVDGSFAKPSFDYKDSSTHKSVISWIYNPVTQLSSMFNGVNYRNEVLDNLWTSYINTQFVGINNLSVKVDSKQNSNLQYETKFKRSTYVEFVYVYYTLFESLIMFAAYWIYKKKIVA